MSKGRLISFEGLDLPSTLFPLADQLQRGAELFP